MAARVETTLKLLCQKSPCVQPISPPPPTTPIEMLCPVPLGDMMCGCKKTQISIIAIGNALITFRRKTVLLKKVLLLYRSTRIPSFYITFHS